MLISQLTEDAVVLNTISNDVLQETRIACQRMGSKRCFSRDLSTFAVGNSEGTLFVCHPTIDSDGMIYNAPVTNCDYLYLNNSGNILVYVDSGLLNVVDLITGETFSTDLAVDCVSCGIDSDYVGIISNSSIYTWKYRTETELIYVCDKGIVYEGEKMNLVRIVYDIGYYFWLSTGNLSSHQMFRTPHTTVRNCCVTKDYFMCFANTEVVLFSRYPRKKLFYSEEYDVQSICITPDNRHFVIREVNIAHLFLVENRKKISEIPVRFAECCFNYTVSEDRFVCVHSEIGSLWYHKNTFITADTSFFKISLPDNAMLVFCTSKVVYCSDDEHHYQHYNSYSGRIAKVVHEHSCLYRVIFDDDVVLMVEWSKDDGFGRDYIVKGNFIDVQLDINSMKDDNICLQKRYDLLRNDHEKLKSEHLKLKVEIEEMKLSMKQLVLAQNAQMKSRLTIALDAISRTVPNSGNVEYSELIQCTNRCYTDVCKLIVPCKDVAHLLGTYIEIKDMAGHIRELDEAIKFVRCMDNIVSDHGITESLTVLFNTRFEELATAFPLLDITVNEQKHASVLKKLKNVDRCFDFFFNTSLSVLLDARSVAAIMVDKYELIDDIDRFIVDILLKSADGEGCDFNLLYTIRDQVQRHIDDITSLKGDYFSCAKKELCMNYYEYLKELNGKICEYSLSVNLTSALTELQLSSIRFPFVPKIINFDHYMQGSLEDAGLFNCCEPNGDRFVKCICVSERFKGNRDANLKALRRELRILTKMDQCTVELKDVVLVPEMRDGSASVKFVCIELERAPYDLDQYLISFPGVDLVRKNSIAQQLVLCVFSMHAKGIMLRDIKPKNILVFCDENGFNPKVKLCDFGVSVDSSSTLSNSIVGTVGFMAPEVLRNENITFESDIFSVGMTLSTIFSDDQSLHCEIIQRCLAEDPMLRPSIYQLVSYQWSVRDGSSDRLGLIRKQTVQFVVTKQGQVRDSEGRVGEANIIQDEDECFYDFFTRVFKDTSTLIDATEYFGATIEIPNEEPLSLMQFTEYIFENRVLDHYSINLTSSLDFIRALCGFISCCLMFQAPVDDTQLSQFFLNALSNDFDKLMEPNVFARVFPNESAAILRMLRERNLNFNFFGGEDKLVASDNINEFFEFARLQFSNQWTNLSHVIHECFHSQLLLRELSVTLTFKEVKTILCGPPRFTAEHVLATLEFGDVVPNNVREAFTEVVQGFNSLDMLQFVYWLNSSPELHSFTVILQPDDTMLPSIALCDHTLRLPNNILRVREGLPLAIRGILPNEFKLLIVQRLSQWTQQDVDELNNRLKNAPLKTIVFNQIDNVPSVRVCPNCLTPTEHSHGCKSMACPTCNCEFCFSCLSLGHCGHFGQCSVASIQQITLEQVHDRMQRFQ
ncbi:hypothetical protein PCE1_003796 [Barthelona sp. PCE]